MKSALPDQPEKAEICVDEADDVYREIRIDNPLQDQHGAEFRLRIGAKVDVVLEADSDATTKNLDRFPLCRIPPGVFSAVQRSFGEFPNLLRVLRQQGIEFSKQLGGFRILRSLCPLTELPDSLFYGMDIEQGSNLHETLFGQGFPGNTTKSVAAV